MAKQLIKFNVGGRDPLTLFVVKFNGSYTIPKSKTVTSPTGDANNSSIVEISGGQLMVGFNDAASGTAPAFDLTASAVCDLYPGDVVACSAVASNIITVTVTSVDGTVRTAQITGVTTWGGVIGYHG